MLQRKMNRSSLVFVSLLLIAALGWGIRSLAQSDAVAKQMEMMKQMMMNRPKAMQKADQAVQKQKTTAMKTGKYTCCLKVACDFCALKMGQCPCGMNVVQDKPVCNECKGGWHAGNGAIPGKKAEQIRTMPRMKMSM